MGSSKGSSSQIIGYSYFLGVACVFAKKVDKILAFKTADDVVARPNLTTDGSFVAKTGSESDVMGSGNSTSTIKCYLGEQTTADPYLQGQTGSPCAYKNTAYFTFRGFVGDNVRTSPKYAVVVERTNVIQGWNYANIDGDANPAHILYYLLTTLAQYDTDMINTASFIECGATLFAEGLGMSFTMSRADECQKWCEEILRTIDGVLQFDENAKIKLKLLRGGYNLASLPQLNEDNTKDITFERKGWEDCYTKITVKYTDRASFSEASVTGINTAARLTLGYEKADSIEFMGISSARNANIVLNRLFKKLSYPLATVKCSISSNEFPNLRVGDVVNFSNTHYGIANLGLRILNIAGDKEDTQSLEIEGCEDIFALGDMVITSEQPSEWVEQDFSLSELVCFDVRPAQSEMATEKALIPLVVYPTNASSAFAKDGANGWSVPITPWYIGELTDTYPATSEVDDSAGFNLTPLTQMWNANGTHGSWQRMGFVAYIGEEQIAYRVRQREDNGTYTVSEICRGLNDTPILSHPRGTKVWFASVDAKDLQNLPIANATPTVSFWAQNFKYKTDTKTLNHNYNFAVETPYPPTCISATREGENVTISYEPRVRLAGLNYRNIDSMIFGEDEGKQEGYFVVEGGGQKIETESLSVSFANPNTTTYQVYTVLNGYTSQKRSITI